MLQPPEFIYDLPLMFLAFLLQGLCIAVAVLTCWYFFGQTVMVAVSYGALTSMLNTGMLLWRWVRGLHQCHCDGDKHLRTFHLSSIERFFVVSIAFAAGFGLTDLQPGGVLTGFIVGQIVWVSAISLSTRLS